MYSFINGQAAQNPAPSAQDRLICFVPAEEAHTAKAPGLAEMLQVEKYNGGGTHYESRDGFDYIAVLAPEVDKPLDEPKQVQIYFTGTQLTFLYESLPAVEKLLAFLQQPPHDEKQPGELLPAQVLYLFFAYLTSHDTEALEDFEETVSDLEDTLAVSVPKDMTERISALRRQLLQLKRYYEALFDLLQDLEENFNGFLDKKSLHAFRLQTNRADRLSRSVLNLRDYVTQVRESYQNQLDIGLNQTMKVFTVVTAIFLPLTLLVGWYGMNLQMPEFDIPWMYGAVIAVSIATVAGLIAYFKKNNWF